MLLARGLVFRLRKELLQFNFLKKIVNALYIPTSNRQFIENLKRYSTTGNSPSQPPHTQKFEGLTKSLEQYAGGSISLYNQFGKRCGII